jgi:hypothetical protein
MQANAGQCRPMHADDHVRFQTAGPLKAVPPDVLEEMRAKVH